MSRAIGAMFLKMQTNLAANVVLGDYANFGKIVTPIGTNSCFEAAIFAKCKCFTKYTNYIQN